MKPFLSHQRNGTSVASFPFPAVFVVASVALSESGLLVLLRGQSRNVESGMYGGQRKQSIGKFDAVAAASLPMPFPNIRLRASEKVDLPAAPATPALESKLRSGVIDLWGQLKAQKEQTTRLQREEAAVQQELCCAVEQQAVISEGEMIAQVAKNTQNVYATQRGLALPYMWYQRLHDALLRCMHDVEQRRKAEATDPALSVAAFPGPYLSMRAAICVAILWRMLSQVSSAVGGMGHALKLFEWLLFCLYDAPESILSSQPPSSLSEQIQQLSQIPLKSSLLQQRESECKQLTSDVDYYSKAMSNWSFQIWRQQTRSTRRKDIFIDRLQKFMLRKQNLTLKRNMFLQWKMHVKMARVSLAVRSTHKILSSALEEQPNVTENAKAPFCPTPPLTGSREGPSSTRAVMLMPGTTADLDSETLTASEVKELFASIEISAANMKHANAALREQLGAMRRQHAKLEKNSQLASQRIREAEQKVIDAVKRHLQVSNSLQKEEQRVREYVTQISRLEAHVRMQHHQRWREAAFGVIQDAAGVPGEIVPNDGSIGAPSGLDIVRDWGNRCLDELASLEGNLVQTGRFADFTSETRDSTLFSRLLFFLALPRHLPPTLSAALLGDAAPTAAENRHRLLSLDRVQLCPPFPTYSDCFGDLHRMPFLQRSLTVVDFAEKLLNGSGADSSRLRGIIVHLDDSVGGPSGMSLKTILSSADLCDGARQPNLQFAAVLYCGFAHAFNHKAAIELANEDAAIAKAASEVSQEGGSSEDEDELDAEEDQTSATGASRLLRFFDPPVNSNAYSWLVRGSFWDPTCSKTCTTLRRFSRVICSLRQSLEAHRQFVTVSCLTTLGTYTEWLHESRTLSLAGDASLLKEQAAVAFSSMSSNEKLRKISKIMSQRNEDSSTASATEVVHVLERYLPQITNVFATYGMADIGTTVLPFARWQMLLKDCGLYSTALDALFRCFNESSEAAYESIESPSGETSVEMENSSRSNSVSSSARFANYRPLLLNEFLEALIRLANAIHPPAGAPKSPAKQNIDVSEQKNLLSPPKSHSVRVASVLTGVPLADALASMLMHYFVSLTCNPGKRFLYDVVESSDVKNVLRKRNDTVQAIFAAYARIHHGTTAIDEFDFMRLAREAGWASYELTGPVLHDIFAKVMQILKELMVGDTASSGSLLRVQGFILALCVIAVHKYPSPIERLSDKLDVLLTKDCAGLLGGKATAGAHRSHRAANMRLQPSVNMGSEARSVSPACLLETQI